MAELNPIERLQNVQWDVYGRTACTGQIASGLLVVVTAVALLLICVMHTQGSYIAANYQAVIALGTVGGLSFTVFALCSIMNCLGLRRMSQNQENERIRSEIAAAQTEAAEPEAEVVTVKLEEQPVEYIKQVIIHPLLKAFKEAVDGVVVADCVKTASGGIKEKVEKVKWAFKEGEELFDLFLDSQQIYVSELLRFLAQGKCL